MTDVDLSELEVPAWPVEAYPFEPAHGLFARFAERNGQTSTAVFASHVGLNWTHPNLRELIGFCSKYPVRHLDRIIAATPFPKDKRLIINDQVFNPNIDWSIYQPRVCEGCLYEAAYYRNWWDITAIHHCPIHDRPLIARKSGAKLTLWFSRVGETPDGERFARFAPRVEISAHKWERYLLGRMGVLPAQPNSMLDSADLCHVSEAVELLGTIAGGTAKSPLWQRPQALGQVRAQVLAAGAPVLLSGPAAIYECAREYVMAKQKFLEDAGQRAIHNAFFCGRLLKLAQKSPNPLFPAIRNELDKAIDDTKVYIRRVKATHAHATQTGRIPFERLVSDLGLRKHQLLQLAYALDMIPRQRPHGGYIPLSGKDMNVLRAIAQDLLGASGAAEYLGVSVRDLKLLLRQNILMPALTSRHRCHDLYRKRDLDALLTGIRAAVCADIRASAVVPLSKYCSLSHKSPGLILSELLAGMLNVVGWDQNQAGIWGLMLPKPQMRGRPRAFRPRTSSKKPGLNKAEVAAALGVAPPVTKALLAAGYLSLVEDISSARPRVDADSVQRFSEAYAPAHLYAEVLQCRPSSAYAILSQHGIVRLPNINAKDASFVERQAVRAVLGLEHDPDHPASDQSKMFWAEFAAYVDCSRSSTRMFGLPKQGKVRLYSGDRAVSVVFRVDRELQTIGYELSCDPTESSRRYDRIANRLGDVTAYLGREAVNVHSEGCIVIAEVVPFNCGHNDDWVRVFGWIEQRMTYFRSIFSHKNPRKPGVEPVVRYGTPKQLPAPLSMAN